MTSDDKYLIERQYDDLLVSEGEMLFEKNAVIDFSQPEKHLFVFVIHDNEDWEVEIMKPFTKIQKSTCSCLFYKKNNICRHILAALFYIRNIRSSKIKPKAEPKNTKVQTLNIPSLLQHVEREELIRFVKQYARDNAAFALQLKIHFARKVDMSDNKDKYKVILDSIIKPYTGKTRPTLHVIKAFLSVSEEFLGQLQDCLALQSYQESLHILETVMYKFTYVRHYYGMDSQAFSMQNKAWHDAAFSFFKKNLPFQLKNQLISFLIELTFVSFYRFTDVTSNTVFILAGVLKGKTKTEFIKRLEDHIDHLNPDEKIMVLALMCFLCEKIPDSLNQKINAQGFLWIPFLNDLRTLGVLHLAAGNIQKLLSSGNKKDKELYSYLFEIYCTREQWNEALDVAMSVYTTSGELKNITDFILLVGDKNWTQTYVRKAEKWFAGTPELSKITITRFYFSTNSWQKLWDYILFYEDEELLMMYDHELPSSFEAETELLYKKILQNHYTLQPNDSSYLMLEKICRHFDNVKMIPMKKRILNFLEQKFAERTDFIKRIKTLR